MKPPLTFLVFAAWCFTHDTQVWRWKIIRRGHWTMTSDRDYDSERGAQLAAKRMLRILASSETQQLLAPKRS